jgi:hypothetical protein
MSIASATLLPLIGAHAETLTLCGQKIDYEPAASDAASIKGSELIGVWVGEVMAVDAKYNSQYRRCDAFAIERITPGGKVMTKHVSGDSAITQNGNKWGIKQPHHEGPAERSTEALGRRARRAWRDRSSPAPEGSRRRCHRRPVHQATGSPIAVEALRRIGELYAIEATIRGRSADERQRTRVADTKPLVDDLKAWLETELHRVPPRSGLAEAIRYALVRWPALCRFLDDGRVELDTNSVERAIRPIALGRKNHMFAGSDGGADRWAIVSSLIATAKLNKVEPYAYLKDVLERMANGHPMGKLEDLLPWNWAPSAA